MRAVRITTEDGPDALELADAPAPEGELLVSVRAAGVSFPDLLMTRGEYQLRQPLPFTLGMEAAGEVVEASPGGPFTVGDRVATLSFGAHAELLAAAPQLTFALPSELSYQEGAALPLNYLTALAALERRGGLKAGETVLVHGAAGGVGTATVQLAKALGAHVIAAVSTQHKAEVASEAGADAVVTGEDFRSGLPGPVDLIVDPVGGQERFTESLRSLAPEGRIVVVGFTAGEIPTVKVNRLLLGNTDVRGCNFGVVAFNSAALNDAVARLSDLITAGSLRPLVGSVYPLERVKDALQDLDNRRATGKLVVSLESPRSSE
jgi:NADPH2:quinone reductase